jgi:cobalt/nickel transport system permease protein
MTLTLRDWATGNSPLHRMDSRWKLAAILTVAVAIVLADNWRIPVLACVSTGLWLRYAGLPWNWIGSRLGSLAAFLALLVTVLPFSVPGPGWTFGPIHFSFRGMELAALIAARAVTVSGLALLLLATTPLDRLLRGLVALRVPGLAVQLLSMTLRYVYLLGDEFSRVRLALRSRGYRHQFSAHSYRTTANVVGSLVVRSQERAERVAQAMLCRGFTGKWRWLPGQRARLSDTILASMVVCTVWLVPWFLSALCFGN